MADAGLRLVVEGEKEFKKALADIDQQLKTNKKELQLLVEQYKVNDDGLGNLTERQKVLADSIDAQKQKVKLLSDQYAEAATVYDENDKQLVTLKNSMLDAETSLAKMTAQQQELNKMQEDAQYATAEYDKTIEQLRATVEANTSEIKAMDTAAGKLGDSTDDLKEKNANLAKQNDVLRKSQEAQRAVVNNLNAEYQVTVKRYGEGSTEAEKYRKKVIDATAELDRMGDQLEENEQAIRNNSKAMDESKTAPDGLLGKLQEVSGKVGVEIPSGIEKMIGGFDGGTLAVGGIVGALGTMAAKMADIYKDSTAWAGEVTKSAQELDLGTAEYQALMYAASGAGVEMDAIADAIKEINNKAGESDKVLSKWQGRWDELKYATESERQEVAKAQEMWDNLGVSIYDQNGKLKDSKTLLYEAIDAFSGMTAGVERSKAMMDLWGESARRLNPLVETGADNLKRAEEYAKEYIVVSDENVAALDRQGKAWERLGSNLKSALREVAGNFAAGNLLGSFVSGLKEEWEAILDGTYLDKLKGKYLGAYATGTYNHPGGLAMVGENGPEIVELPRGSKVYPNGTAPAGMGGGVYIGNITIPAKDIREFNDIVDVVQNAAVGFRRG